MLGSVLLGVVAAGALAPAQPWGEPLGGKVSANVITRAGDPSLRIVVPRGARYAGAERWPLYDVADCELHLFVNADAHGKVRKLYWIQFEQFLPNKPDLRYTYGEQDKGLSLWGGRVWAVAGVGRTNRETRVGSDREHLNAILERAGFTAPPVMMQVRLVRLLDDDGTGHGRRELMLIYAEDLALSGEDYQALGGDGDGTERWRAVEPALIARGVAAFKVTVGR